MTSQALPLWQSTAGFPPPDTLATVPGMRSCVVHEPDEAYAFLHDCTVAVHEGAIHTAWYNCPRLEMQERSVIRGRWSADGGRNWSAATVLSAEADDRYLHVPAVLHSAGNRLRAWTCRMAAPDVPVDLLLSAWDQACGWRRVGVVAERFLPNNPPMPLPNGGWLMAGRMAREPGERALHPAVAMSAGLDGRWEVVPMAPGGPPMGCPESTVLAIGDALIAVIRPGDWVAGDPGRHALACESHDGGRCWSPITETNLPMQPSKPFGGSLRSGHAYLIFNAPGRGGAGRELLVIAVAARGSRRFSRVWALQDGSAPALGCGPEWSYPFAVEDQGWLHVVYTSGKQRCVLSSLPVEALTTDPESAEDGKRA